MEIIFLCPINNLNLRKNIKNFTLLKNENNFIITLRSYLLNEFATQLLRQPNGIISNLIYLEYRIKN